MEEKKKIIVISDHPMSPSGVGTQTKYFLEALLKTGRYKFICFGGAIQHADYRPMKTNEWGEDLVIIPVKGYGDQNLLREAMWVERPDALWIMTDPRFWGWLWEIEEEIRSHCPLVYYHVWDNYPYPHFNRKYYRSNDAIATISKVTDDIVKTVTPEVKRRYIPHAVPTVFSPSSAEEREKFRKENFGEDKDKLIVFWNNRNARRKMSGSLIFWFKKFLDKVGHDKAMLIMHTETKDPHGQDLDAILLSLDINGFKTDKAETDDVLFCCEPTKTNSVLLYVADTLPTAVRLYGSLEEAIKQALYVSKKFVKAFLNLLSNELPFINSLG